MAIRPFIKKIEPDVIYCSQAIFSIFSIWFSRQRNWLTVIEWLELWPIKHWCANLGLILGTLGYVSQRVATKCGDVRVVVASRFLKQLGKNKKKNILLPGLYMQKPNNIYPSFKIKNDKLFLARLVPHKQPLLALAVIFQLHKLGWQGIFHIIGTGTLIDSMRKEILDRQMTKYVNLIENASEDEVESCFEKSFALIHPSKQEGYGLVVIEAAERGIPTILIDYPCNASLDLGISPDYFSKTDDPIALAILILQAFENQEQNYIQLKNWNDAVLPKLNADKSVDSLVSIFEKNITAYKISPETSN
jgi:glycosyltransferase involved in cell wall biosynthesis